MAEEAPKLTTRQRRFIDFYLGGAKGNGAEAARLAGYSDAPNESCRLLKRPHIRGAIEARLVEEAMSAGEVLRLLTQQAKASLEDFLTWEATGEYFRVDLAKAAKAGRLHLLKSIKIDNLGRTEVEIVDTQAAVAQLGRYHKLFTDRVSHGIDASGIPPALMTLAQSGPAAIKEMLQDARRAFAAGGVADDAGRLRRAGPEAKVVDETD